MTTGLIPNNVMPYMGVQCDRVVKLDTVDGPRTFRLITYQAYNALGLIGPEHNGVAIFDLDRHEVLCDRILEQDTGYYGASAKQVDFFNKLVEMSWDEFKEFVNSHPQHRYKLQEDEDVTQDH